MMELGKLVLLGKVVTLEPLGEEHLDELVVASQDPSIWEWMTFDLTKQEKAERFVKKMSANSENCREMIFAIRCNLTHRFIGSTGYWNFDSRNRRVDIGGSWVVSKYRRSGANIDAKYLLLKHAFEILDLKRVGFSIDSNNVRSLKAIDGIGATKEGLIRNDRVVRNGRFRSSVIYSVLDSEWGAVKLRIEEKMARYER